MRCLLATAELEKYLLEPRGNHSRSWWQSLLGVSETAAADSRLKAYLSPSRVIPWLQAGSTCGHEQLVQLCIEYMVGEALLVDMQLLRSLDPAHAEQLLTRMRHKLSTAYRQINRLTDDLSTASSKVDKVAKHLGAHTVTAYTCKKLGCKKTWLAQHPAGPAGANCPACHSYSVTKSSVYL